MWSVFFLTISFGIFIYYYNSTNNNKKFEIYFTYDETIKRKKNLKINVKSLLTLNNFQNTLYVISCHH